MGKYFVAIFIFLLKIQMVSAGSLTVEVVDTVNDPTRVWEYRIYQAIGDQPYDADPIEKSTPANPVFTHDFPDGDCYRLAATAVSLYGEESPKSQELELCMDAYGNPTFPNGPSPPTMKIQD
jgi:hypothetical protein